MTTSDTVTPLSAERLAEIAKECKNAEGVSVGGWRFKSDYVSFSDMGSIITELLALRTQSPAEWQVERFTPALRPNGRIQEASMVPAPDGLWVRHSDAIRAAGTPSVGEGEALRYAFRNVDGSDWKHLFAVLPDTYRGRFWKAVMTEAKTALEQKP